MSPLLTPVLRCASGDLGGGAGAPPTAAPAAAPAALVRAAGPAPGRSLLDEYTQVSRGCKPASVRSRRPVGGRLGGAAGLLAQGVPMAVRGCCGRCGFVSVSAAGSWPDGAACHAWAPFIGWGAVARVLGSLRLVSLRWGGSAVGVFGVVLGSVAVLALPPPPAGRRWDALAWSSCSPRCALAVSAPLEAPAAAAGAAGRAGAPLAARAVGPSAAGSPPVGGAGSRVGLHSPSGGLRVVEGMPAGVSCCGAGPWAVCGAPRLPAGPGSGLLACRLLGSPPSRLAGVRGAPTVGVAGCPPHPTAGVYWFVGPSTLASPRLPLASLASAARKAARKAAPRGSAARCGVARARMQGLGGFEGRSVRAGAGWWWVCGPVPGAGASRGLSSMLGASGVGRWAGWGGGSRHRCARGKRERGRA
jgi:hypothetical protein